MTQNVICFLQAASVAMDENPAEFGRMAKQDIELSQCSALSVLFALALRAELAGWADGLCSINSTVSFRPPQFLRWHQLPLVALSGPWVGLRWTMGEPQMGSNISKVKCSTLRTLLTLSVQMSNYIDLQEKWSSGSIPC